MSAAPAIPATPTSGRDRRGSECHFHLLMPNWKCPDNANATSQTRKILTSKYLYVVVLIMCARPPKDRGWADPWRLPDPARLDPSTKQIKWP